MKAFFYIFSIVFFGFSCKTQIVIDQKPRQIIQLNTAIDEDTSTSYTIHSAKIEDNLLILQVKTKGSNYLHELDLLWDGFWMKSLPPKVVLVPMHKTSDTKNKKDILIKAKFMLDAIAAHGYDKVVIIIKGYNQQLMWQKQY